jgi:aspartyl-tRNA(Asn)/glutamyl-tRNA(Gln) amidotransferase subunit B
MPSSTLAHIISLVVSGTITNNSAKRLLSLVFEDDSLGIETTMQNENMMVQDIADDVYATLARELTEANPEMVRAIKEKGQRGKVMWFVGQMMREMSSRSGGGGAEPEKSKAAVLSALDLPS